MGGKSYFCDYCQCYMKTGINVRKVHATGLTHKITKAKYLRRFVDPAQTLAEEEVKVSCSRYHVKGFCKFDMFCQFSHYTTKQLEYLRSIVKRKKQQQEKRKLALTTARVEQDWQKTLPWNAGSEQAKRRRRVKLPRNLPPSLKPLKMSKLTEEDFEVKWG